MNDTNRLFYFSYGSNMSTARLKSRVASAEYLTRGELKEHKLKFHKKSKDGSGKCDAYKTGVATDIVWGAIFSIPESDLNLLDKYEGRGFGYERVIVSIHSESQDIFEAQTYIATQTDDVLLPYDWYKVHILRGAHEIALPRYYIDAIEAIDTIYDTDETRRNEELKIYNTQK